MLTKNMYMLTLSYENFISEGCENVQNIHYFKCFKKITENVKGMLYFII